LQDASEPKVAESIFLRQLSLLIGGNHSRPVVLVFNGVKDRICFLGPNTWATSKAIGLITRQALLKQFPSSRFGALGKLLFEVKDATGYLFKILVWTNQYKVIDQAIGCHDSADIIGF
jgi:hypothetical protein